MTPELIADVAKRMGWQYEIGPFIHWKSLPNFQEPTELTLTDSGIVALIEWALANGWWIFMDGDYVIEHPATPAATRIEADSLAEALCLARCSEP